MLKVVFIGLGTMGVPMAHCLANQSFTVSGWDVDADRRAQFPHSTDTAEAALEGVSVVVTMLPNGEDVRAVYEGLIFPRLGPGVLLMDCSTIDVETTRALAGDARDRAMMMVDAPVSGGAEAAAKGQLSFMVGASAEAFQLAKPLLEAMGDKITHFGESGAGQAAKACHNLICGVTALGVCEAFALAEALGLDSSQFFSLCRGAAAQSWILENRCPVPGPAPDAPSSNQYRPGFAARLMAKDLKLAQQAAKKYGQETEFGAAAAQRFSAFVDAGHGDLDFSAIYQAIRHD